MIPIIVAFSAVSLLVAFAVFAYRASTALRGAGLNAMPMVGYAMLVEADRTINRTGSHFEGAVSSIGWICVAAFVGLLLSRRGRLLRSPDDSRQDHAGFWLNAR